MTLSEFAAAYKRTIFEELQHGSPPSTGTFDEELLKEAKARGKEPQIGETRFAPRQIFLEYIFNDPINSAIVFTVTLESPQRIVYLPVPSWVVESIWEGEVTGSYHFENDAVALLNQFHCSCEPGPNAEIFGAQSLRKKS